ncbi:hypothetical protein CK516_29010 [Nostoc sp. 'Peltigera malacea cyanobiont' DB3992]|nr:hypothetical protein CK516_29010 [Nostoc sp. 'Peltigera malacea cyanobiont' DB3992]
MKITPNKILYINLGPDNKWRKDCIYTDNTICLGHIEVSHQLCLECKSKNKWSEVEEELKKYFTKNKVVKRCKQISNFYVSDENTLWITIFEKSCGSVLQILI